MTDPNNTSASSIWSSAKFEQAIKSGFLRLDPSLKRAEFTAPPRPEQLTDEEWLALLAGAGELGSALEELGYTVIY